MLRAIFLRALPLAAVLLVSACRTEPGRRAVARVDGVVVTVAELARVLPLRPDSAADKETLKLRYLDELVNMTLFVHEAERRGLDSVIGYQLELDEKAMVTQELYNAIVAPAGKVTPAGLDSAYAGLATELHLRVLEVESETLALRLERELAAGVPFESLAVRWSVLPNAAAGGDAGWVPMTWVEEPIRAAAAALESSAHTPALAVYSRWQLVKLEGRRAADPAPPPVEALAGELSARLRQFRQQGLAQDYLGRLRRRLVFVPEGLDLTCRPPDSLSPAELEVPVAIRDSTKYVKVARLLHVMRRFPTTLDTAMKKYAIRREVEEDLLYEDGLTRGLDKLPAVRDSLAERRRRLLYEALYRQAVGDSVDVSEAELRQYYDDHRDNFPGAEFEAAAAHIRQRLLPERRVAARAELVRRLREKAKIAIDEAVLRGIRQEADGSWH